MSRAERDKLEIDGVHYENNDIKDIFEDAQDILEDYMDLADDFDMPAFQKGMELDYKQRHQSNMQNVINNF